MLTRFKRYFAIAILLGVGGWLAVDGWGEVQTGRHLAREGIITEGRVIDHSSTYRSKQGLQYHLTVEFTPTNQPAATETFEVESAVYHRAIRAGVVPIRYLPADPNVCAAGDTVTITYMHDGIAAGLKAELRS